MAVTDVKVYAPAVLKFLNGAQTMSTATYKALALASNGAFDPTAAVYTALSDAALAAAITSHEFDGTNYARQTLANVSLALTSGDFPIKLDADDNSISNLGAGTNGIEGWLIYIDGVDDDNRFPLYWLGYASPQNGNGNLFTIQYDADGVGNVNQAA
ncbi:MAG: hypothetical protein ACYTGL_13820 [Planctomycetota bacterium]|jgi:hypothetical protein